MEFNHEGELPGSLSFRVFGSPAALAQAVAGRVHEAVLTGVRMRGRASLLLDAGPVLRRGYELLAAATLPWGSVRIALSPAGPAAIGQLDPRESFLRDTLLRGAPSAAQLALQGLTDDEVRQSGEPDLLLLAMSANGSISALSADVAPATITAISALESRRIVIVGQGLTARDAFERQALAQDLPRSALQALAQEAVQPIEFCWCR